MRKVSKFQCWICHEQYSEIDAKKCEEKGIVLPRFNVGDTVNYRRPLGDDNYVRRTGEIINILFLVPPNSFSTGQTLSHAPRVHYLVRSTTLLKPFGSPDTHFFDEENIDLMKKVEVVPEEDISSGKVPMIIVPSWEKYVAEVVKRNPQLKERFIVVTAKLREIGCLDD